MINNDAWISEEIVLIDTWWNVNFVCTVQNGNFREVLIDTWWNVNRHFHVVYELWYEF